MNKNLIFLLISVTIVAFTVITLTSAPVINKNVDSIQWVLENCKFIADEEEMTDDLDTKFQKHKNRTLCERRKAMYSLEYASFIFDIIAGFFCALLSFLQYLQIGKDFKKNTGLIGLICGVIGFILTFIYFVYSAYIFTNDNNKVKKLFPNGAIKKLVDSDSNKYITAYEGDKEYNSEYAKYKDLGKKQYNYDSSYYDIFHFKSQSPDPDLTGKSNCLGDYDDHSGCEYLFDTPKEDFTNKYLYDKWTTTLIFAFLISLCNLGLALFGFLVFKGEDESSVEMKIH